MELCCIVDDLSWLWYMWGFLLQMCARPIYNSLWWSEVHFTSVFVNEHVGQTAWDFLAVSIMTSPLLLCCGSLSSTVDGWLARLLE